MSAAEKQAAAERMKKYWAAKKASESVTQSKPATKGGVTEKTPAADAKIPKSAKAANSTAKTAKKRRPKPDAAKGETLN